jgi:hypothetical protein
MHTHTAQFKDWFSNPLTGAVETGQEVSRQLVERLHGVLRPFLLRCVPRCVAHGARRRAQRQCAAMQRLSVAAGSRRPRQASQRCAAARLSHLSLSCAHGLVTLILQAPEE